MTKAFMYKSQWRTLFFKPSKPLLPTMQKVNVSRGGEIESLCFFGREVKMGQLP